MDVERFVVITVSDTCSSAQKEDKSGPYLVESFKSVYPNSIVESKIIPDDEDTIAESLIHYADVFKAHVILTTGGTGFAKRDVTPEATRRVIHKEANGIETLLLTESLRITPMASLSRLVSGIRNSTLIINFPGSLKAVRECFDSIKPILPHALALLHENKTSVELTHTILQYTNTRSKEEHENRKRSHCVHTCPHQQSVHGSSDRSEKQRQRESPYPMIEVSEATDLIMNTLKEYGVRSTVDVQTVDSLGLTTAQDIKARDPFPPFEASIKDGYACLTEDGDSPRIVCGDIAAGDDPNRSLEQGECVFINTGAPIPANADCVIQIEDTLVAETSDDGTEISISILKKPELGQDIRKVGSDIEEGEIVIHKGSYIGPVEMGLLATVGVSTLKAYLKPDIGILSTGNELQPFLSSNLKSGHIRDSNKIMLTCLFGKLNINCHDFGIVRDDPTEMVKMLKMIFEKTDILITTGSVSMGDKDYLKPILLREFNAEILFGRLNMRPGKPTTFATCMFKNKRKYIFALPGNPVSAFVTSNLLVIPALKYWMGQEDYKLTKINVELDEDVILDPRPHYARATMRFQDVKPCPLARLTGNQISSRLMNSSGANVLIELPSSKTASHLAKGTIVSALLIN